MAQMTMQLAALNGKNLMNKNRERCGTKLLWTILNFPH
jgi:hypothetical protein